MAKEYTAFQRQAIDADGRDICVAAGAGSGKTGVLVERYVRILVQSREEILPPRQRAGVEEILVITFTEKATREMKTRIVAELTRLGLTEERRKVESAYISTIHGFCSRLLQENPFEVGIDPHFSVLDESQAKRLLRRTIDQVIEKAYETDDREITELVALAQNSRQAGEDGNDPIFPLAASVESVLGKLRGAGITRQEVERFVLEGPEITHDRSEQVVWFLLTPVLNEIAACMEGLREISANLIGSAKTSAEALLAQASALACSSGPPGNTLAALREIEQVVRKARSRIHGASLQEMTLVNLMGRIKALCDEFGTLFKPGAADEAQAALACHRMWGLTAAVWKAYEQAKRSLGRVDNDDLQAEGVRLLEESAEVRERYRRRLRYLMVDEFQDTSPLQMRLIELLHQPEADAEPNAGPTAAGSATVRPAPNYLFVVGDVQQSIYAFRSAEPGLFRTLERRYREENAGLHVPLAVNFRSRPEILRLISQLFKQIWRDAETPFVPLECGAPFEEKPVPSIEFLLTQDLMRRDYIALEPEALARRVRQMVEAEELRITAHTDPRCGEPVRYRDIVVLLRQLTDIQRYEEAFARQGVPYFVVGGGRGYYARQEIRDLRNILIVLDTPMNDVALMAALRSPMVGADTDTLYRIVLEAQAGSPSDAEAANVPDKTVSGEKAARPQPLPLYLAVKQLLTTGALPPEEERKISEFLDIMDLLREQEDRMPVGHLLERLIMRTRYDARLLCRPGGRRRLANVRKLLQMANSDSVMGVRDFIRRLQDLEKLSDREGDAPTEEEAADVVRFHTIHGAKGLEFPIVILADLCRSLEHSEKGLFACDPSYGALGTRLCGDADLVYKAIDRQRQASDREESERLLYVAMTRAREHLILCGNLGRNRGYNWGDRLFSALGILEIPDTPVTLSLLGGQQARCASMAHYFNIGPDKDGAGERRTYREAEIRADQIAQALLDGQFPDGYGD